VPEAGLAGGLKPLDSLAPDQLIDERYRLLAVIGQGGMGRVYEAMHVRTHKRVALKVLEEVASRGEPAYKRFEKEAQAAARVGTDRIVDTLDFGELDDGRPYLVMELCQGESLSARLRRSGRLPPDELVQLVLQLLDGLGRVHAAGIVRRDLKPANVFLLREHGGKEGDYVKLLDFGICKFYERGAIGISESGTIVGTPSYASPEQTRGEKNVDQRADIVARPRTSTRHWPPSSNGRCPSHRTTAMRARRPSRTICTTGFQATRAQRNTPCLQPPLATTPRRSPRKASVLRRANRSGSSVCRAGSLSRC
jgi:serine/threonine protein kinase